MTVEEEPNPDRSRLPLGWSDNYHSFFVSPDKLEDYKSTPMDCSDCGASVKFSSIETGSSLRGSLRATAHLVFLIPTFKCEGCGTENQPPKAVKEVLKQAHQLLEEIGIYSKGSNPFLPKIPEPFKQTLKDTDLNP